MISIHPSLMVLATFWADAGCAEITTPQEPSHLITAALADLTAKEYGVRQAAMEKLWAAGEAAIPFLEAATQSKDAEVRYRARFVLDNLQMGITLDTPKSILREVQRFRSDSVDERRRAMHQLEAAGRPRIVLALAQSEPDSRLREEWYLSLERSLIRAIVAEKLDEVAETLRRAVREDAWARHWAAFAVQCGDADEELSRLAASTTTSDDALARKRMYLLRAKGELADACRHAERISPELYLGLLTEKHDWGTAARLLAARIGDNPQDPGVDIGELGQAAAYARLAGYQEESDRLLASIQSRAENVLYQLRELGNGPQQQYNELVSRGWHLAKVLLLNGRYDEAMGVMRRNQPSLVFELLCEQQRYREAFSEIGVSYPQGPDADWFRDVVQDSAKNTEPDQQRFAIAQLAIRHLYFLGRRDDALQFFTILVDSAQSDRGTRRLRMLCDTAVKLSLRDRAVELAALIIQIEDRPNVLSILYPSRSSCAAVWWEYFRDLHAHAQLLDTLKQVEQLFHPAWFREGGGDLDGLVAQAASKIPTLPETKQIEWFHELAETCVVHGRRDLALNYYARAASSSVTDALKLGDLLAADGRSAEAANWYEKAWQFDRDKPLPLYLHARALQRSGQQEKGSRLTELALLMPMANTDLRHELASGLKERGYREEARQQFEFLLRTGELQHGRLIDAAKQLGNLVHGSDELRAAECWESMVLCCLKPNWGFVENGGYIQIPQLVHKTRALGLVKAGRLDEAVREIWASYRAAPATSDLAEELVPILEAANRQQEANELLVTSANRLRELGREFPQCATFHNNLAWLLARCGRELDEALEHSRRALELEPEKPSFIDTLAEIHFRRGEIEEAIVCAERCVQKDPRNSHYQAQRERFQTARQTTP